MEVPYELFWHLTPSKLDAFRKAYIIKQENKDEELWRLGLYFRESLESTVCNSTLWRKNGSKPHEYPDKPLLSKQTKEQEEKRIAEEMTPEERKRKTELFFTKLNVMAANARLDKKKKEGRNP